MSSDKTESKQDAPQPAENELNQQRCIVYEFANFDEPRIRRINKCCVWKSDGHTVHVEKNRVVCMADETKETWIIPFDRATVVGVAMCLTCHVPALDGMPWIQFSSARIPSKRMLLVIQRDYPGRLYADDCELVRTDKDLTLVRVDRAAP